MHREGLLELWCNSLFLFFINWKLEMPKQFPAIDFVKICIISNVEWFDKFTHLYNIINYSVILFDSNLLD